MGYRTTFEGLTRLERAASGTGIAMLERGGVIPAVAQGLLRKGPTAQYQAAATLLPVMDRLTLESFPEAASMRHGVALDQISRTSHNPQYGLSVEQARTLTQDRSYSGNITAANALAALIGGKTLRAISKVDKAVYWAGPNFTRVLTGDAQLSRPIQTHQYVPLAELAGLKRPWGSLWRALTLTDNRPVVNVPFDDARTFAATLALLTGESLELASMEQLREAALLVRTSISNTTGDPIVGPLRFWAFRQAYPGAPFIFGGGWTDEARAQPLCKEAVTWIAQDGASDVSFRLVRAAQPKTPPPAA